VKYSVFSGVLPELSAEEVCRHLAKHGYDGVGWRVDKTSSPSFGARAAGPPGSGDGVHRDAGLARGRRHG
jgi:hypothetical protein